MELSSLAGPINDDVCYAQVECERTALGQECPLEVGTESNRFGVDLPPQPKEAKVVERFHPFAGGPNCWFKARTAPQK